MFSFLNTGILLAAAAALIPLIIHLFSRRQVKIIDFSSLKHLKALQRRQVKRLRIRQLLLLILRMLIIFTVVLAFARPTTSGGSIGSHASVSAVILFDNSASVNRYVKDGLLFDLAKNRALELLNNFGEGDELAILSLSKSSESDDGYFSSPAVAREKLESIEEGYSPNSFTKTFENALELLEKAHSLNKEIYIVSDAQRNSLSDKSFEMGEDIKLYIVELPTEEIENVGIVNVDFGGRLLIPGKPFELTATLKNYGENKQDEVIASLFVNGNRVSQTNVTIDGEKEATVRFTHALSSGGYHSGVVELSDDKFPSDNHFYFSFQIPEIFNVLIIDGDESSDLIKLALVPSDAGGQYWSVKQAVPENLTGINFRDYDVVILSGAPILPSAINDRLKAFVKSGRSLLITYGAETDINNFNSNWSEISGIEFVEPLDKEFSGAGFYSIAYIDNSHPAFSVFDFGKNQLPQVRFFTLPKVTVTGQSRVLMRFSGDRSALVENKYFDGRVLTFCAPVSPLYTDLTAHAFFVPFLARISEYLASRLSGYDLDLHTGDNIVRIISLKGSLERAIELQLPDSEFLFIPPVEGTGAVSYSVPSADRPGIYRAFFERREIDRFAVNIDPH
ncbi:MAG TPA: VWA domain-containing protein, partial [candidate division Zixibacteria bacterium]|nr:VWA domain-containing protein [candidate division Zixibacteria bacterium]